MNWILATALACLTLVSSAAATFYASPTGSDMTGDGSIGNPWQHVQTLLNNMSAGDTGYLRGGKYDESDTPDMGPYRDTGTPTRLLGFPGETVLINNTGGTGSGAASVLSVTNWWWADMTLSNFNIGILIGNKSAMGVFSNVFVTHIGNQGIHIHDCYSNLFVNGAVSDTKVGGSNGEGFYVGLGNGTGDNTHHITIRSNYIFNVHDESIEFKEGGHDNIAEDNLIDGTLSTQSTAEGAIELDQHGGYGADPMHIVRRNIIHDFGGYSHGIHMMCGSFAYNNVLYNEGTATAFTLEETIADTELRRVLNNTIDCASGHRITINSTQSWVTNNIGDTTTGNIALSSAYFVNYSGHNYRLVSSATAAIDSGSDLSSIFTSDFDGVSRPQGSGWDMGAFELLSSASGSQGTNGPHIRLIQLRR